MSVTTFCVCRKCFMIERQYAHNLSKSESPPLVSHPSNGRRALHYVGKARREKEVMGTNCFRILWLMKNVRGAILLHTFLHACLTTSIDEVSKSENFSKNEHILNLANTSAYFSHQSWISACDAQHHQPHQLVLRQCI